MTFNICTWTNIGRDLGVMMAILHNYTIPLRNVGAFLFYVIIKCGCMGCNWYKLHHNDFRFIEYKPTTITTFSIHIWQPTTINIVHLYIIIMITKFLCNTPYINSLAIDHIIKSSNKNHVLTLYKLLIGHKITKSKQSYLEFLAFLWWFTKHMHPCC